jgi:hypothetical protein
MYKKRYFEMMRMHNIIVKPVLLHSGEKCTPWEGKRRIRKQ